MIICEQCGNQNDSTDTFCGSCGAFLEWQGQRVEEPAPEPEPAAEEAADPGRPGIVQRVKTAIGIEDQPAAGHGDSGDGAAADDVAAAEEARRQAAQERAEAEAQAERAQREAAEAQAAAERAERLARERAQAAAQARAAAEEEARRAAAEQEARARAAEEERARAAAEEESRRAAAAAAEEEARERAAEEERARAAAEEAARVEAEEQAAAAEAEVEVEVEAAAEAERQAAAARRREEERAAQAEREAAAARQREEAAARVRQEAEQAEEARRREEERAAQARRVAEEARRREEEEAAQALREAEAARRRAEEVAKATAAAEAAAERARAEEARREEAARRAAAMVAQPKKEEPPPPPPPVAVRPTEERARPQPKQPAAPAPVVKPGDLICGQCGEGNDPARNFCRRCGHTLATAVMAKVPWWRRLFTRRRRSVPAGARPGRSGGGTAAAAGRGGRGAVRDAKMAGRKVKSVVGKFRRVAALLLLVGCGLAFLGPFRGPASDAYQSVKRIIKPEFEPVRPVDATASSSAPGRDPKAVIDGIKNTFWAEGAPGPGDKQTLTITFGEPTDLDKVGIIPGASEDPAQFVAQPRPRVLHLVFNGATPSAKDISVQDSAKFQSFDVDAKDVTSVLVEVVSVHASTGNEDLAITELEFFRKK